MSDSEKATEEQPVVKEKKVLGKKLFDIVILVKIAIKMLEKCASTFSMPVAMLVFKRLCTA
jgi:hypothetical protein